MKTAITGLVVVILFVSTPCVAQKSDTLILGTINSYPFTQREFELCTRNYKSITSESTIPSKIYSVIEFKIQQQLALKLGLLKDISYKSFYKSFRNENQRRRESQLLNKVFYGPNQFTEDTYFCYYITNLTLGIKQELLKNQLRISTQQLQALYKQNKEKLYKIPDIILCLRAEVKSNQNDSICTVLAVKKMVNLLNKSNSITIDNPCPDKVKISVEYLSFNPETDKTLENEEYFEMDELTKKMKTGEIITKKLNSETFRIFKLINRKKSGYRSLNSVKTGLILLEEDRQYAECLRLLLKRAKIVQF